MALFRDKCVPNQGWWNILPFVMVCFWVTSSPASDPIDFNRDISPILSNHCYECHGPDQQNVKGKLRLDSRAHMDKGGKSGKPLLTPGNPDQSELIARILSEDPDSQMPPPEKNNPLSPEQTEKIRLWVKSGASYQSHWAYHPIEKPEIPKVQNRSWPANPIDYFVLHQLEKNDLAPAREADKRTLLRRVYLNLIGIPPTTEEMAQFLGDESGRAWMKVLEDLLGRHEFGQKWGRHWLDVVRYADSNGSDENHSYPHAHHYRNYVIDAFNQDLPFDRFIMEQLAGDLVAPEKHSELITATGFLAIGTKILAEQDPVKKLADTVDEQIDTFSKTFLALTVSCARCHDHKFDQIPTTDYYALAGIFHSSSIHDGDVKDAQYLKREMEFTKRKSEITQHLDSINHVLTGNANENSITSREAESFSRGNVTIDKDNYGKGIGIISDPGGGDNYAEYDLENYPAGTYMLELRYAALQSRPGKILLNSKVIADNALARVTGGWMPENQKWHMEGIIHLQDGVNVLRFESKPNMSHIDKWRITRLMGTSEEIEKLLNRRKDIESKLAQLTENAPSPRKVMAVMDGKPHNSHVHIRGDFNNPGNEVPRSAPLGFGFREYPITPDSSSGRKQLAQWLAHPENPLTARVMVNRLWHWHFGRGIVDTPNNFGVKGGRPTHPELLDYLAWKLISSGWSLKAVHREIINSKTYRMASGITSEIAEKTDPENRFLWRQFRRRMDAEVFRDSILAVAGKLDTRLGGGEMKVVSANPSPTDLVKNQNFYETSPRRSVYLPIVRSNIYDLFSLMDFPNSTVSIGKRNTTTIPTQALMMMNSPFFIDQAGHIAGMIANVSDPSQDRNSFIHRLYQHVLTRPPTEMELQWVSDFVSRFSDPDVVDSQVEALQALAHTLIISDDFLYIQ